MEITRVSLPSRDAPDRLSPSRVSTWRTCQLAFAYRHLIGLPDPPGEPAVLGTFVHAVLERLHALEPSARTIDAARALAASQRVELESDPDWAALALDDGAARAFRWRAWHAIEGAFHVEDPAGVVAAGQEVRLEVEVDGIRVLGFADRIDRERRGLVVTDYKTGAPPGRRFAGEKLVLMDLYAVMVERAWGQRPVAHRLLFLRDRVELRTPVNDARCRAAAETLAETWEQVGTACRTGEFEARASDLCAFCAFRAHCPLQGGEVVTEAPIEAPVRRERLPLAV